MGRNWLVSAKTSADTTARVFLGRVQFRCQSRGAKGLTFETLLMPRLVSKSFTRETDDLIERLLFVGITRAMTRVYLSSTDPGSLATLGKVREAQHTGSLAVRGAGEFVSVGVGSSPGASGPPVGDGLLDSL